MINDPAFRIKSQIPADCLAAIGPSEQCKLEIEFSPLATGTRTSTLTLETNAIAAPSASISLQGGAALPPPLLSLTAGVYTSPQTVSISEGDPEAAIYYTTNGNTPSATSARYTGPLTVASTERLTAIAIGNGSISMVATADYTIAVTPPAQTINLSSGFTTSSVHSTHNTRGDSAAGRGSLAPGILDSETAVATGDVQNIRQ